MNNNISTMSVDDIIGTLGAPTKALDSELCAIAREASAMVAWAFPDADINTQTLKLEEECAEMFECYDLRDGLVDVAIVALQLIYDYKSMLALCALRGALFECPLQTEEAWKEFLSVCHTKIGLNYVRKSMGFWSEPSHIAIPTYARNAKES